MLRFLPFLYLAAACSQSVNFANLSNTKTKEEPESAESDTEVPPEQADEPVWVNGSYLTCSWGEAHVENQLQVACGLLSSEPRPVPTTVAIDCRTLSVNENLAFETTIIPISPTNVSILIPGNAINTAKVQCDVLNISSQTALKTVELILSDALPELKNNDFIDCLGRTSHGDAKSCFSELIESEAAVGQIAVAKPDMTGLTMTCGRPIGVDQSSTKVQCRLLKGDKLVEDPVILENATWNFDSSNTALAKPQLAQDDTSLATVDFLFSVSSLAPVDLTESTITYRSPATEAAKLDISNKYHNDCGTFISVGSRNPISCTKRTAEEVGPYPFVNWQWKNNNSYEITWEQRESVAVGTIIIQNMVSNSSDMSFVPVNGMQYTTGTTIGNFLILYVGSEYTTETAPFKAGDHYYFKILHFDEHYNYGLEVVWDILR